MEELKKYALELAVQYVANKPSSACTVYQCADEFLKWLKKDSEAGETPQSKDMVSKAQLKEMLPSLGGQFKRNRFPSAAEIVGYKQAIDDIMKLIDEL